MLWPRLFRGLRRSIGKRSVSGTSVRGETGSLRKAGQRKRLSVIGNYVTMLPKMIRPYLRGPRGRVRFGGLPVAVHSNQGAAPRHVFVLGGLRHFKEER